MRISNAIFILIILTVISAIVWIRITEIEEIIRAEGQVEPKEQIQIVQPRFTGKIRKNFSEYWRPGRKGPNSCSNK